MSLSVLKSGLMVSELMLTTRPKLVLNSAQINLGHILKTPPEPVSLDVQLILMDKIIPVNVSLVVLLGPIVLLMTQQLSVSQTVLQIPLPKTLPESV